MGRRMRYAIWAGAAAAALGLFFAFGLPAILRAVLESQLEKNLHRPASVAAVRFNPFKLLLTVEGLAVRAPDNSTAFVSFERLAANVEISSLLKGGIILSEVILEKPFVRVVREEENRFNFSDLADGRGKKSAATEPSKPVRFSVANIRLAGGSIEFDDRPKKVVHRVTGIELGLPLVSNFAQHVDVFVQPSFSATVDGRPIRLQGRTKPFADSLETTFDMHIADLSLARYLPYVPARLNFNMPSGRLSIRLKLQYVQSGRKTARMRVSGNVRLAKLTVVSLEGKPVLSLPSLAVSGVSCALSSRTLAIDEIAVQGLSLALAREKDGALSLQKLVAGDNETGAQPPAQPGPAWSVQVKKLAFSGGAITFDDLVPHQPAHYRIDALDFTATNIATAKDSRAELDLGCRINNEGKLGLKGSLTLVPLAAQVTIDLTNLDIRFAQSYMPDTLLVDLTGGALGLKGSVDFKQTQDAGSAILWQGDISLANFATSRRGGEEDLLKFSSLDLQTLRAGTAPLFLDIKTVKLAGLFMQPVVEADGTVNLTSLNAAPEAPEPQPAADAAAEKEPLPNVTIGSLVLEKGLMKFTDKSIKPRYSADLADINGRITGISTKPGSQADIRMTAKLNRYAPFKVAGTISPLSEKLSADIKVNFDNIDLSPFSPYSGKFIGRMVEKGRLSLELTYTIKDNKLTSQNKVFLDQFTLGKSVASKDATSLPVGLAISLLKDRKGEIHLDLPVSGSLDDPSFKVGKVVLQTLVNLLEKAATSPFALVGVLIPGGEKLSRITFPCGTSKLGDEAIEKLDALAGLLAEKPGLSLEIQAVADADADREGLRQEMVLRRMRRLKFDDMSKKEREGLSPEQVVITSTEYEDYLWQAYKAGDFEKPTGFLGLTRRLPADEMKELMAGHMQVADEDLKELVHSRGLAVKQYLNETGGVAAGRLLLVGPRIDPGRGPSGCAVEFTLK